MMGARPTAAAITRDAMVGSAIQIWMSTTYSTMLWQSSRRSGRYMSPPRPRSVQTFIWPKICSNISALAMM